MFLDSDNLSGFVFAAGFGVHAVKTPPRTPRRIKR
jgi:hypothetical protein